MSAILTAAITVGAAARLTRLATRDTITAPLRERVLYTRQQRAAHTAGDPIPPPTSQKRATIRLWAYELTTCDWCAGLWISAAVIALAYTVGPHPLLLAIGAALATSYLVGWLSGHE